MGGTSTKQDVKNGSVEDLDMSVNDTVEYAMVNLHMGTLGSVAVLIWALVVIGLIYKAYRMKTRSARNLRRRAQFNGECIVDMKEMPSRVLDSAGPTAVFPR